MHTIGTPWASAFMTVPWPQWVIAAAAWSRIGPCGADGTTVTLGGPATASGASIWRSVTMPSTGSDDRASTTRCSSGPCSWYVVLKPTSTSGSPPSLRSSAHGSAHVGSSRMAPV